MMRLRAVLLAVCVALTAQPASAQATLRLAAYNIKHGQGMDGEVDLERVAGVLRALDADVITLQEMDDGVGRTDGVRQAEVLGEMLGMSAFFGDFMPYQGGEYGMAVLSRLPVVGVTNHRLPDGAEPRTALEVRIAAGDRGPISIVGIHFYRTPEERFAQADSLANIFEDVEHPVILAGDFNSRRGDRILSRLQEEWSVLDKDGPANTFPSDEPAREIDFVMVKPAGAFEVLEHRVIDERVASDHRPLLAVFRIW